MTEELKIKITAEIGKFKKSMEDSKKEINEFWKKGEEARKKIGDTFKKIGEGIKAGLKVGAAISGATAALTAFVKSTEEFREGQAKITTAFGEAGASAKVAKQTYNDLYRVMGDDGAAVEAANHLAKLTTNQKDLSQWTNICQGVYATFGDSLPIEGLTEAANETAKVGKVTGTLADALNWAGVNEDAFNDKLASLNTEAEREALIRDTLNGLYTDAAASYEENNADVLAQRDAQTQLNQAMADVSATLQPLITTITEFAANVLTNASDAVANANEKLDEMKKFYEDNKAVIDTVIIVVGIFAVALGIAAIAINAATIATGLWSAAATVATVVTTTFGAAMAFLTNPITLIVLAIASVIAVIVILVRHWDKLKEKVSSVVELIKSKIEGMKDKVRSVVDEIKGFFQFKVSLPHIKLPHFSIKPRGWSVGDLLKGSIPKLGIEWYAKGGVFEKPTAFGMNGGNLMVGGEAGAEAIVPLEKNTEWLDRIADRLAAKQGTTPIVLNVDGKTFAQTSINSINQLTKQTGKLGLKLS